VKTKRLNPAIAGSAILAVLATATPALGQTTINNGDFTAASVAQATSDYGSLAGNMTSGFAGRWGYNKPDDFSIIDGGGGDMKLHLDGMGSNGRGGVVFDELKTLTGTGWYFQFEADLNNGLSVFQVWAGVDDNANVDAKDVMKYGGTGGPEDGVVVGNQWDLILDISAADLAASIDSATDGPYQFALNGVTFGTYDLAVVKFIGNGSTGDMDNFGLIQIPPTVVPVADFSATTQYGELKGPSTLTVDFTDLSTEFPTSWSWDFGAGEGTSTDQNPSHDYTTPGIYTVTLTSTNGIGDSTPEVKTAYAEVLTPTTPVASFTATPVTNIAPLTVNFTDTSANYPTSWLWDFGGTEGTSTDQNPSHEYTIEGTYTVTLTATNTTGSSTPLVMTDLVVVAPFSNGIVNADISSTVMTQGDANAEDLGYGWFAKGGDSEPAPTILQWSAGATAGTAGVMTQVGNSGSATRFGQYFGNILTGTGYSLDFDLGGTAWFEYMDLWAGTLDASPSGTAMDSGTTRNPSDNLVVGSWTKLLEIVTADLSGAAHYSFPITQDLGSYDVMVLRVQSKSTGVGTTYDNFEFVGGGGDTTPPNWIATWPQVDGVTATGGTARAQIDEDGTAYYVVLADGAAAPSSAQVEAGNDAGDSPALQSGSIALTATTEGTDAISGLTENTAYDVYFVAKDGVPNLQASPVPVEITTQTLYAAWSGGETFDGDKNGDGVDNGIAFLLGAADPDADALGLLPTPTEDGSGGLVMTFSMLNAANRGDAELSVQHSSDLGITDAWLGAVVGADGNDVSFSVTPNGGDPTLDDVVATIDGAAAMNGKLFGRLLGTED